MSICEYFLEKYLLRKLIKGAQWENSKFFLSFRFLTEIILAMIQISQNGSKEIEFPHCDVVPRVLTEKD